MKAYLLDGRFVVKHLSEAEDKLPFLVEEVEIGGEETRLSYDKDTAIISSDLLTLLVERGSRESGFLEALFFPESEGLVSWDDIAAVMGTDIYEIGSEERESLKKSIQDVRNRLNKKISKVFGIAEYFTLKNGEYGRISE